MQALRIPSGAAQITPSKFYAIVALAQKVGPTDFADLAKFLQVLEEACDEVTTSVDMLAKANNALLQEARQTSRRKNPFDGTKSSDDLFEDLRHTVDGNNFLRVIFDVVRGIEKGYHHLLTIARGIHAPEFVCTRKGGPTNSFESIEDIQRTMFEMDMNSAAVNRFLDGILAAEHSKAAVISLGRALTDVLAGYHETLIQRHSVEGVQIHCDPVTTDVALSIFENVDAHGEIRDGKKPNEISAYSMRKAAIIIDAVQNGLVGDFIRHPDRLIEFLSGHLLVLWGFATRLHGMFTKTAEEARAIVGHGLPKPHFMHDSEFDSACLLLRDLDPRNVTYKEKTGLQTPEERHELAFQNETLRMVTHYLSTQYGTDEIIQYILDRKAALRDYHLDVNSFYVCRIGNGNPFLGEAPGALKVVPGTRPVVDLDEIVGSGFDEVKAFIGQVEAASQWHDLFVATSPSRTADKSNVLLIGPQGSGKSEVLRAVGGDRKSIGVFAQGSDFLTCWSGESQKNPKRLFEEGLKLQRESRKHVHFLIDEIDAILNSDRTPSTGYTNLTLEFQILMDGVVHYPNLSVWGATNHPERIPMPMMRRFSKVLIVGELSAQDRVKLLQHFMGFMPLDGFRDTDWMEFSEQLTGAVGDIIRKICDHVWREKMSAFVGAKPQEAKNLVEWLNEGGSKFSVQDFNARKRAQLHERLRPYVLVRPADLAHSIETHLNNVAIHHEIRTAVETYERARSLLADLKRTKLG